LRPENVNLKNVVARTIIREGKVLGLIQPVSLDVPKTDQQIAQTIGSLNKEKIQGLILDLRNVSGSDLALANAIAGLFLQSNQKFIQAHAMRKGVEEYYFLTSGKAPLTSLPLVILINEQTAGSSEALAGSLAHYQRAYLVGSTTAGIGTLQRVFRPDFGDQYQLVAGKMHTHLLALPDGSIFNKVGVKPHLGVSEPASPHLRQGDITQFAFGEDRKAAAFFLTEKLSEITTKKMITQADRLADWALDAALTLESSVVD